MKREEYLDGKRDKAYQERIGKVYGDFKVISVLWDSEKRKQVWRVKCEHCGREKETTAWQNYTTGKLSTCKKCTRKTNTMVGTKTCGWKILRQWTNEDNVPMVECECIKCGAIEKLCGVMFRMKKCKNCGGAD